jgi:hypothetical protein
LLQPKQPQNGFFKNIEARKQYNRWKYMENYTIRNKRLIQTDDASNENNGETPAGRSPLTAADFFQITRLMGGYDVLRKIGFVAVVIADKSTRVVTYRKGKETDSIAQPGDYIATNLTPDTRMPLLSDDGHPDQYVIKADRFDDLYEDFGRKNAAYGRVYKAKSIVKAVYFQNGFDICPPWGGSQVADSGYLFLNGSEVYGCESEACEQTYTVVAQAA